MATKRALVLSGGGARGAYHVGVLEALVAHGWMADGKGPDIIAGTSIGAINAAAIASGRTIAELKRRWLGMHTEDVHQLSPDLPPLARPLARLLLRSILTSEDHAPHEPLPEENMSLTLGGFRDRVSALFTAQPFRSLLDTAPWRHTLASWMDFERINSPDAPALLLTATDVQTGALRTFCNRTIDGRPHDVIAMEHLLASSSIPMVYPWTEIDGAKYWDGAVLSNTPLGPIIDLAGDDDLEILVVLMTPWHADESVFSARLEAMPQDMAQAIALTLDWALLASYRSSIKMLRNYNQLADAAARLERAAQLTGDDSMRMAGHVRRRIAEPTVIAPEQLMPLEWIIDYEERNHHTLFEIGYTDAERALAQRLMVKEVGHIDSM
jgi:NTE family protein